MIDPSAIIHPRAHVDAAGIAIGPRTRIWQFASVIRRGFIGADGILGSCAIIDGAKVGDGVSIGHGVSLNPGVIVLDRVFIGPNVTFCNDFWPSTSKDGFDVDKLRACEFVTTLVDDGASIGAGAVILPGVTIGARAMIAAGAVVDRSVPEDHLFRRGGCMEKIDHARTCQRMRRNVPNIVAASA